MKKSLISFALLIALEACSQDVEMSHNKPQASHDGTDIYQVMLDKFISLDIPDELSSLSVIDINTQSKPDSIDDLNKVNLEPKYNNAELKMHNQDIGLANTE